MNEEQIKDIFEQELDKTEIWFGAIDGCYHSVETAMLATIKRVLDLKNYEGDTIQARKAERHAKIRGDAMMDKWPRDVVYHEAFNGYIVGYEDCLEDKEMAKLAGNCKNCGTPHYLSPIGLDGINCELCQPED